MPCWRFGECDENLSVPHICPYLADVGLPHFNGSPADGNAYTVVRDRQLRSRAATPELSPAIHRRVGGRLRPVPLGTADAFFKPFQPSLRDLLSWARPPGDKSPG